jgi:hypothetical protein
MQEEALEAHSDDSDSTEPDNDSQKELDLEIDPNLDLVFFGESFV